jgi:hypothetical protein
MQWDKYFFTNPSVALMFVQTKILAVQLLQLFNLLRLVCNCTETSRYARMYNFLGVKSENFELNNMLYVCYVMEDLKSHYNKKNYLITVVDQI